MAKGKVKVYNSESGYNLAAKEYDKKEGYLNSFEKNRLLPLFGDVVGNKILDVGAGTGRIALQLAKLGADVTALDVSPEILTVLKQKNSRVETVIGDAENLPFLDASFDSVVSAFVIVHLKDLHRSFDEAYRVLKDGGTFIVTNINQKDPPVITTKAGDIVIESYYHRPEKVRETLESLAFTVKEEISIQEKGIWINQILVARK